MINGAARKGRLEREADVQFSTTNNKRGLPLLFAPALTYSTRISIKACATASASDNSLAECVVATAITDVAADRAARMPGNVSSTTTHFCGATPVSSAAFR